MALSRCFDQYPLVCLERATAPLMNIIPDIQLMVQTAKVNCSNPDNGLTQDEAASIMLYSMESFSAHLNEALQSDCNEKLELWCRYLGLFSEALSKLKSQHCTVYRILNEDVRNQYTKGKKFQWRGFISGTNHDKLYNNQDSDSLTTNIRTLFIIDSDSSKDISNYAYSDTHDDTLLRLDPIFEVISLFDGGDGRHFIQIKEIDNL